MTPALLWFSFLIGGYALFSVIQAARHSSLSKPWHMGGAAGNMALPGQKARLLKLFVLANAILVIFPASVYRFGFWGLLWPVLMVLVFVIYQIVTKYGFPDKNTRSRPFLARGVSFLKNALIIVGSLWFLSWQLGIMVQFVTALTPEGVSVSLLKTTITLFLLVTALFAGEQKLYDYVGAKLLIAGIFCILACVVLFAYIGSFESFARHVQNYYQLSDATEKPVFGKVLALWPALKADLVWEMLLAGFLGLFVLALREKHEGVEHFGQMGKGENTKTGAVPRKMLSLLAWMVIGFLCLGYSVVMGFGAHFTGADTLYLKSYGAQVSVLFDPVFDEGNLPALFLKSLAAIIPSVVGLMTALIMIALLSTAQMLLFQASRLLAADVIVPVIGRLGAVKQDGQWLCYLWQMRSYTLVLVAALIVSEL